LLVLDNGTCPVREFLTSLSPADRRKVDVLVELFASRGKIANKEKFKKIEGTNLFEFKSHQIRLICFFAEGKRLVICRGLIKKKEKHDARDLDNADNLRKAFLGIK
jgi:mRNA-degrading endonuclease RelE of RelBE toxin-antitoxin system